jgi:hypothetical protein
MKKRDPFMAVLDVPRIGFEVLSLFDWITPLFKAGSIFKNDPVAGLRSWCFFIPNTEAIHAGWDRPRVKSLLQYYGITVYGDMTSFSEQILYVPISQAAEAEGILKHYGVPIKPRSRNAPRVK